MVLRLLASIGVSTGVASAVGWTGVLTGFVLSSEATAKGFIYCIDSKACCQKFKSPQGASSSLPL